MTKVKCVLCVLCGLLLASGCGKPRPTPTPTKTPRPPATSTPLPMATPTITPTMPPTATPTPSRAAGVNPLTGLTVSDSTLLRRRPLHVRIGNDLEARPQSGLAEADLVYEEISEGWWVTRLTAVYLAHDPEVIGPIRSSRLINLELTPQFDAALVHAGASDPIRWMLSKSDIVDLDEYFTPDPYFYIEEQSWRNRLWTGADRVRKYLKEKGWEKAIPLRGFTFSPTPPEGGPATYIHIPYPPKTSDLEYRYDPETKTYLRFVLGEPHEDAETGEQLSAANVIVQYAEHQKTDIVEDERGVTAIRIVLTGEDKAQVFRDGVMIEGTWQREREDEMMQYLDKEGEPIPLKPGNSWIEIVPLDFEIEVR